MMNILTVDVEDWYHDLNPSLWRSCEDRVVGNTKRILRLLDKHDYSATFFVLGCVAERFPKLVEQIEDKEHEVATHGYLHVPINNWSRLRFENDLRKSISILENITQRRILGHRASHFSINNETAWAIDILKKNGLRYDSSIFPLRTPKYGFPQATVYPYRVSFLNIRKNDPNGNFIEFPLSTYKIPLLNIKIPIAGGFYLRFFPYWLIKTAIKKINKMGHPAVIYIHPGDLDPEKPKIKELSWIYYYNLSLAEGRFKKLLDDFSFTSIARYLEEYEDEI
jgi:polysaccharide deacetylase family protein (PEP-CTERM system associated)